MEARKEDTQCRRPVLGVNPRWYLEKEEIREVCREVKERGLDGSDERMNVWEGVRDEVGRLMDEGKRRGANRRGWINQVEVGLAGDLKGVADSC